MPLFEPGRRPLRPTELGASLARLGNRIRTANREASLLVRRFRQGLAGRLRVGGSPIFTDGVVAKLIAEFQSRYSDVYIDQSYGYLDALEAGLRNGGLDIAILPLHPRQVPSDMEFLPLLSGRNVVACRQDHPLTRIKAITSDAIAPYSWIAAALQQSALPRPGTRVEIHGTGKVSWSISQAERWHPSSHFCWGRIR